MKTLRPHSDLDGLSEALCSLRFRSNILCRSEMTAPWGFEVQGRDFASFHLLLEGAGVLTVDGVEAPFSLSAGIHLQGKGHSASSWLSMLLRFLSSESKGKRPGGDAVLQRLCDLLFIEAMRSFFVSPEADRVGLAVALRDPRLASALALIHRHPEADWDLATLARRTGMSRTVFATRFAKLVGQSPLKYVARCRVDRAASLLRSSASSLSQIAEKVGYTSGAAFGRAFRRHLGVSPARFRSRAARALTRAKPSARPRGQANKADHSLDLSREDGPA